MSKQPLTAEEKRAYAALARAAARVMEIEQKRKRRSPRRKTLRLREVTTNG